jgi:hypothetical protein
MSLKVSVAWWCHQLQNVNISGTKCPINLKLCRPIYGGKICHQTKFCDVIKSGRGLMTSSASKCQCQYLRNQMSDRVGTLQADIGWQGLSPDKVFWPHQKCAWPDDVINFEMLMSISGTKCLIELKRYRRIQGSKVYHQTKFCDITKSGCGLKESNRVVNQTTHLVACTFFLSSKFAWNYNIRFCPQIGGLTVSSAGICWTILWSLIRK